MSNQILDAISLIDSTRRGFKTVHKFGRNNAVGTSFVPASIGGIYRTPQPASATTLRVKSGGNANDAAAGTGAQKIKIYGLNASGVEVDEEIATAGASASAATVNSYIRLFRAYVIESGTYATSAAGSHSADIVIENTAGTEDWATISVTDFPRSQSEIGAYTVPLGFTAYVLLLDVNVDSNKTADLIFFKREGVLDASAPYSAMRVEQEFKGVSGDVGIVPPIPTGPFPELTDIGFMAKAATSAEVDVDFLVLLAPPSEWKKLRVHGLST